MLKIIILQSICTNKNTELTLQREHHIQQTEVFKGNCSRLKLKAYNHNSPYYNENAFSTNENELIDDFWKQQIKISSRRLSVCLSSPSQSWAGAYELYEECSRSCFSILNAYLSKKTFFERYQLNCAVFKLNLKKVVRSEKHFGWIFKHEIIVFGCG